MTMFDEIFEASIDTLLMVGFSTFFAILFGLPLGIFLFGSQNKFLFPMKFGNAVVGYVVNIFRSFPFIILIVILLPLSRLIVGTSIGVSAAIVSLSIAATPFMARLFEGALQEVDKDLLLALTSMGASKFKIICVLLLEVLPSLINVTTVGVISILGYSAMAGALGAGGLGDLAIRVGFQSSEPKVLFIAVVLIIIFVQIIQSSGDFLSKRIKKKRGLI